MCQRAGGGEKGTCVQVLNLPKTGYLTWRKSKKSTSMNWAGRDHPRSRRKLCRQGPWVLGNKRLTLSLCTPLHLVGDWPRLHHRQYHLSGMLGGQSRYDLFNTQQGVKGNSPAWSQEGKNCRPVFWWWEDVCAYNLKTHWLILLVSLFVAILEVDHLFILGRSTQELCTVTSSDASKPRKK